MFCKECGKQIEDDSKFCMYCGKEYVNVQKNSPPEFNPIITNNRIEKINKVLGLNISNKLIGFYLLWVLIHFIILLINGQFETNGDFWPITDSRIYKYDISEFLIFTIVPLMLLIIMNFLKSDKKNEKYDLNFKRNSSLKNDKYDLNFKRKFSFLIWGVILTLINITFWIFMIELVEIMAFQEQQSIIQTILFFSFFSKLIIVILIVSYVKLLKRNRIGWGIFAFFFPRLCLILVSFQRKLNDKSGLLDEKIM